MPSTTARDRETFATTQADAIAGQADVRGTRAPNRRGWTTTAVWYEDATTLTAVVGPHEGKSASLALAHGLHLAGTRPLHLLLPAGLEGPTLVRVPWFDHDITVTTHSSGNLTAMPLPTRAQTIQAAGGPASAPALHLGAAPNGIRQLADWAARHEALQPAHRADLRAWTCQGMRVLTLTRARAGVAVTAGINAKATPAHTQTWTATTRIGDLATIKAAVEKGIAEARNNTHGPYEEHHLQELLRLQPHLLGLEHPVLREVPAFRPSIGPKPGRGYIDLAGLDGNGDLVLVETKLGGDDMLVLQGLDYWIWANNPANRDWLTHRLDADPRRAQLKLVYGVGGRMGAPPRLDKYAQAQLQTLHPSVDYRIALIDRWKTHNPTVHWTDGKPTP